MKTITEQLERHAGYKAHSRSTQTGTLAVTYVAEEQRIDVDPEFKYVTVCQEHATMLACANLVQARYDRSFPREWCEECRQAWSEGRPVAVRVPKAFVDDHVARDLPTPELVHETGQHYWLRVEPELAELVSDAEHYLDPYGPADSRLQAAARRLLDAIRRHVAPQVVEELRKQEQARQQAEENEARSQEYQQALQELRTVERDGRQVLAYEGRAVLCPRLVEAEAMVEQLGLLGVVSRPHQGERHLAWHIEVLSLLDEHSRRMRRAWELVCPAGDWKAPVDAVVEEAQLEGAQVSIEDVAEAVVHFTSTIPSLHSWLNGSSAWCVRAKGYRMGPAGP